MQNLMERESLASELLIHQKSELLAPSTVGEPVTHTSASFISEPWLLCAQDFPHYSLICTHTVHVDRGADSFHYKPQS